jgi:16S rRNA processing protein RimM
MALVTIGRIGRPHGVRGEVRLEASTLDPDDLLSIATFTWRGRDGATRSLRVEAARPTSGALLVHFQGVADRDQAKLLGLGTLLAERERLPDPGPGVAYTFELIGLRVVTEDGRTLGTLQEVMSTGAHPIYVVRGERELLIPAVESIVRRVDLKAGVVTVALPAGLEEL